MSSYRVIFLGLSVAGPEEEIRLIKGLQVKFNLSREKAENLLQRVPIVVKKSASKEEMEKYEKAFREIGGRVRIEEEPDTLSLGISPPPVSGDETEREPYSGPKITCPQCGCEQPETDECTKCGVMISKYLRDREDARTYEGRIREISSGGEYAPWESGEGFIGAFLKTTREALFSPSRFFKKVATGEGYWAPLIYAMISGIIGFGAAIFWPWFLFSRWFPVQRIPAFSYNIYFIITIALPLMVAFSLLFESGVAHLCLMTIRGNRRGFQVTFRAIAYCFSGYLFGLLPFLGSAIGGIYTLVLTIIGIREGHSISTGKAVLAVLLPIIIGVSLGILVEFLIPFFLWMTGFSTEVNV